MDDAIYCVIDASASMHQQDKFKLCLNAAQALALSKHRSISGVSAFSQLPKIRCVVWRENIFSLKEFDRTLKGSTEFSSLQAWCDKKLLELGSLKVMLFSDGGFYDTPALTAFKQYMQLHSSLKLAVIGVGADQNPEALKQILNVGQVYSICEIMVALSALIAKPLAYTYGVSQELERLKNARMSQLATNVDEASEEDEW